MLLDTWEHLSDQIKKFNSMLEKLARKDPICQILRSIPGVGVLTALSFKTSIDDPSRFRRVSDVGAFLGLMPKKYQSGEVDRNGGISKQGNRIGYKKVIVALARKLTTLMLSIWKS
ncbi:hypothetical protein ID10_05115 [Pantoea agglomerans]|nr:hypothetical protein ID10_05115 [Pantoea agglomerans]